MPGPGAPYTQLDDVQVIKQSFNEVADSLRVNVSISSAQLFQLFTLAYDSITVTYPSSTKENYQSRTGGIGGAVQQTITVNYVDSSKTSILNIART